MNVGWGKMGATASTPRVVGEMVTMEEGGKPGESEKLVKRTCKRGERSEATNAERGSAVSARGSASYGRDPMV